MASSSKLPPPKKEPLSLPPPPPPPKPTDPPSSPPTPSPTPPTVLSPPPEDSFLAKASHLTRKELLRRRLRHVKQLSRVYRDHFWALMEECRAQHRDYYWRYGVSPFQDDDDDVDRHQGVNVEGCGETNANNNNNNNANCGGKLGLGFGERAELKIGANNRCTFVGCKFKAMALTSFCHLHILSDPNQQLYKSCSYVIKSAQAGPIVCGKPILRSTVPSLCSVHFQKAQKHVTRALRKAGLNSSSTKLAPKFHVIVTEYVRQIQAKRRASQKPSGSIAVVKEECVS